MNNFKKTALALQEAKKSAMYDKDTLHMPKELKKMDRRKRIDFENSVSNRLGLKLGRKKDYHIQGEFIKLHTAAARKNAELIRDEVYKVSK